jgi:hypothetical protein
LRRSAPELISPGIVVMMPQEFIAKWGPGGPAFEFDERQGAQAHLIDLCQMLDPPGQERQSGSLREIAIDIAVAAKKLNDRRENRLNPPAWTHKVPEVTPLGMDKSPYPDRVESNPGITEADLKALQKRTLTNLYNAKPAWLSMPHQQLDQAVAAAYGWTDDASAMPDDAILKRLLALNLA